VCVGVGIGVGVSVGVGGEQWKAEEKGCEGKRGREDNVEEDDPFSFKVCVCVCASSLSRGGNRYQAGPLVPGRWTYVLHPPHHPSSRLSLNEFK
jgi:hypothetical protein